MRNMALLPHAVGSPSAELGAGAAHHPPAQLPGQIGRFGDPDERIRQQQPPDRVPPTHQRLSRHDGAGPQVDLGQVVQQQRFAIDIALQMQLDVVAEGALERHVVGGHRDLVAAPALGRQHGLVGPTEQIGAVVATRRAHRHPDADGAGDHVAADGQALAQHRPQATGERLRGVRRHRLVRDDDELVTAQPGDHALCPRTPECAARRP